ncbi:MAG: thiamine pyrophosphate-dependent dehydrogenase E1 component subunit alpha [Anaerolineales bacterium]|nr:thiamine pyrophosphate-dependent dehydrogenase E1 component subunit alpha [Anaerolineales bacterium]
MTKFSREQLLKMYQLMITIRRFEDRLYQLFLQGLVPGTLHQYQGQEAVAVGVCTALEPDDIIFSTHRPVGHGIAKGMTLKSIAAEIMGKADGCAGGKGGQMHLTDVSVGMMPSNAIVGANIPIATGAALGFKLRGEERVSVSFFGDGAANIGAFHEGINLAAVKNAPVIFVCENNQYAASTHISLAMKIENIADRAASYGIPGQIVDGMDVIAVREITQQAIERARKGDGPTLIEAKTYRYMGHSRGDPGQYRSEDEISNWRSLDPVPKFRAYLLDQGINGQMLKSVEESVDDAISEALDYALAAPDPHPSELYSHVYANSRK